MYVLSEKEYGRVIATLIADCRYRHRLEWTIIGSAEKYVLSMHDPPEEHPETKEQMIGSFVERLFIVNQMALIQVTGMKTQL